VRGEAADARSDLYSFGISLYELLTGKLPFQGDSQYSLMTAQLNQQPPSPISLRADVPPALNEIILMAMAKEPADRFQSADAFCNALKSVPVSALPSQGTTFAQTARPSAPMSADDTLMGTLAPGAGAMGRMASPPATTQAAVRVPVPAAQPRSPSSIPTVPMAPAPGMAAAAAESAPASYAPPPARSSSRGLWLAIGSLLGAGVLIAAGVYIPRRMKTHADPEQSNMPSKSTTDSSAKPSSGTDAPVSVTTPGGSVNVDGQGNVSVQAPGASVQAGAKAKADGNARASGQSTTPPVPAGPSPEEIAKMEDEADRLGVRAATASRSVETLRQQQQADGYNLRADISSAQDRMQMYLAKGDAALKAKDMAKAQKYFDLADAEISKVEKFLGH
jgi:eukaryotic-like serine/threonine-protein kinase